jgi:uncharacterized protein
MTTALWIVAVLLVLAGLAGTVLPVLPGTVLVFAGLLLAAWLQNFSEVGGWAVAALGALTLLSFVVDFAASALGARRVGASRAQSSAPRSAPWSAFRSASSDCWPAHSPAQ